jgi:hypothetical protein
MDYEKVKGIVDAVQDVYQICTHIFDGLRGYGIPGQMLVIFMPTRRQWRRGLMKRS